MAELRFSRRAEIDLARLADYTISEFGIDQARRYRDKFQTCFRSLQDHPWLGRSAKIVSPGLRSIRQQVIAVRSTCRPDSPVRAASVAQSATAFPRARADCASAARCSTCTRRTS